MANPPPPEWQDQLQASLRRAQDAIQKGVEQQDEMVRAWTAGLRSAYPDWGRERWQRRLEKKLRKRAEREAKIANASLFEGYVWVLAAIVMCIVALSPALPVLWWLIFPAIGLGSRGTRVIARHMGHQGTQNPVGLEPQQAPIPQAQQRAQRFGSLGRIPEVRPTAPVPAVPVGDPRDARVDAICDRILSELKDAPPAVKEIFRKPEETVNALRATCRDLTRRERDVRRFLSPEEDTRLTREREALQKRIDVETDEVTKMRLASALAALDQQRTQRQELARSAARFDAEHTRISYTLESLYTQVVRMRSADAGSADVAGAGLRRSLDLLSHEVNALADALEKVNTHSGQEDAARLRAVAEAPATGGPGGTGVPGQREKA